MMNKLRSLIRDDKGAAIIELAIVAPVLAVMTVGIVDMSNAFSRKLALEQGAQRAIEKIMQTTGDDSVQGTLKKEAVCQVNGVDADNNCKTSPITSANVTVNFRLSCSLSGVTTTLTTQDSVAFDAMTCPPLTTSARYISIIVTDKYTPMFKLAFAGLDSSDKTYHLSAEAGMRIQ